MNISVVQPDLADMQLISTYNKELNSKYAWVIPLKDKKDETITKVYQKVLDESGRKPNKIWVRKGSEF